MAPSLRDVRRQRTPRAIDDGPIDLGIDPSEANSAGHRRQRHRRHRFLPVRTGLVHHLPPHSVGRLHRPHTVHLAAIISSDCARACARRERRQCFGEPERRKSVSAPPWDAPIGEMDEYAVFALKPPGVGNQHGGEVIEIAFPAWHPAAAREDRRHHEHVVCPPRAVLRVTGRRDLQCFIRALRRKRPADALPRCARSA